MIELNQIAFTSENIVLLYLSPYADIVKNKDTICMKRHESTSMFVIDINAKKNTVVLGDNENLFNKVVIAKDVNLIAFDEITEPVRVEAKIRYSAKPSPATVYKIDNNKIKIVFDEPQRAITKGQSVVMYNGDVVVGGGIIC